MSHIVKIACEITDLDAVEHAARELGWEFHRGATSFNGWFGGDNPCEHKISIPGAYRDMEIGLVREGSDRHYTLKVDDLLRDERHGPINPGNGMAGFLNRYQVEKARRYFRGKGILFSERRVGDKTVLKASV